MAFRFLKKTTWIGLSATTLFLMNSCDLVEELNYQTESEKTVSIFTEGGVWNVDTLVTKTDLFSGGNSIITTDSTFTHYGTIEFQKPNQTIPGYGTGFMIHKYTQNGISKIDTAAWTPYNFQTASDGTITLFFALPGKDFVVSAYDMYLNLDVREKNKVRISGWRRQAINGGAGGSYGSYRRYHLTR